MYELIITEKPAASKKIADALADGKPIQEKKNGVSYYKITHGKTDIIVACAVGHLYSLAEKEKGKWTYPVFNIDWKPTSDVRKESAFAKKYLTMIKKLAKDATSFTVATDFDIEGEVIGRNVIKYACKKEDANRMKFSTLTKPDLVKAYENKSNTLDWGQANAGLVRHELDWYYGINLSRALTSSVKAAGSFKIMSSGRVQGPALKIVVDREKEILAFKPVPYWQIELNGYAKSEKDMLIAWHEADKFWKKEEAEVVMQKVQDKKNGTVTKVEKSSFQQKSPVPFDLTTLQTESYRCLRISPKETLSIAQELYIAGLISYPRTSSQQLPDNIGFKKILEQLSKNGKYKQLCDKLLSKTTLKPNNGKKTDPAHPAIYPTGIQAEVKERKLKVYDLIVKRFMATFAEDATRETNTITITVEDENFVAKGTRTIERGWHVFYDPYVKLEEEELPAVKENDTINVKKIEMHEKETQPPKRYTPSSIIRELEKRNLGTKSTRAQIVDTLFQRHYVEGPPLQATILGIKTIETLEKWCPKIIDDELTRKFEDDMEEIRGQKKNNDEVLGEAKEILISILGSFKKKEKDIGKGLIEANRETQTITSTVGKCPTCKDGTLMIKRGKFGMFVACDKYPDCKTTFKLPSNGKVVTSEKMCEHCKHPMISVLKRGKKQEVCINIECPSKNVVDKETKKEMENIENGKVEKKCKKCDGNMVLRKSIYGQFYGCNKYPKCRYTEKIENNGK